LAGIAVLAIAGHLRPDDEAWQRTMLLSVLILLGISALLRALTDGEPERTQGDRRFRLLGALAIPVYLTALYWPFAASFFELTPLGIVDWGIVLLVAGVTYGMCLLLDGITRGENAAGAKR
jgi:hypothetical protein